MVCLAAEQPMSQLLTQFMFNLPVSNAPFQLDFVDRTINATQLHNFLFKDADLDAMKEYNIFKEYNHALEKVSTGS